MKPFEARRRFALLAAVVLVGLLYGAEAFHPATATPLALSASFCAPPRAATSPGAKCAFDIWGRVTDAAGNAFVGALVYDDTHSVYADSDGYYDLYEVTPGNHPITAESPTQPSCQVTSSVDVPATAIVTGNGQRQDFQLPCQAGSGS